MPAADDGIEPLASGARRRLEAIRDALVNEMRLRLLRLDTAGGNLATERESLDNARKIRTQVLALMKEDGLPVVIREAERHVAEAVELALGPARALETARISGGLSVTLDAEAKASIERSVSGVLDEVALSFREGQGAVRKAIDVGLNTAAPMGDLIAEVSTAMNTTFAKASVAVETAVRSAHQHARNKQAIEGAEEAGVDLVFVYVGSNDSKTRPFCRRLVDRAFTMDAIRRMDNGQGMPVETARGGHNCRHQWAPMLRDQAEAEGIEVNG